jgi:hypothetical protein
MYTMFRAPGGDYCHGLIHPEQMGPNRPGPTSYPGQPLGIEGLYLGSAGCHGGPGHHVHARLQRGPGRTRPVLTGAGRLRVILTVWRAQ